jgi:hypothetical protein
LAVKASAKVSSIDNFMRGPNTADCFSSNIRPLPHRESFSRVRVDHRPGNCAPSPIKATTPDAMLAEIAAMNGRIDALGPILDSDPRHVTKTGVMQADGNEQD